jgi:hypothetical protein
MMFWFDSAWAAATHMNLFIHMRLHLPIVLSAHNSKSLRLLRTYYEKLFFTIIRNRMNHNVSGACSRRYLPKQHIFVGLLEGLRLLLIWPLR